jgi:signal transduction histidine kinase
MMQLPGTAALRDEFDASLGGVLLESVPAGVLVIGPDRRVLCVNPAARRFLFGVADLAAVPSVETLPEALRAVVNDVFRSRSAGPAFSFLHRVDGSTSLLGGTTTVAAGPDGAVQSVLVELRDFTAAREIAAKLEHLDRLAALGVVTAGVGHEIKNALVAVHTFFELLAAGETDNDLRMVAAMEIQRIDRTVRQLLRGARRNPLRLAPLSTHVLLEDALHLLRHPLQARAIQLESHFAAQSDRVNGDERQLRHAVLNLLLNAIEAMGQNGGLTVITDNVEAWERNHVRVTISDTGCGISADNMPRVFSPFFTTKSDGTGLGLAISQRIVQEHNGAITVESEANRGTTFRVLLPLL